MEGSRVTHIAVGCVSFLFPVICVPLYLRILYTFIRNKHYRKLECYRLMIQIGIAQCLMAPSWVFTGIGHLLQYDWLGMASFCYKLVGCFVRTEALLSLLLALNRLKIICGLRYPQAIHTCICITAWMAAAVQLSILVSPLADFHVNPLNFRPTYDYSKPYSALLQRTGSLLLLGIFSITLLIYVIIVTYLITKQCKAGINSAFSREKAILTYAIVRFMADFTAALLYHFGPSFLPKTYWVDIFVFFSYPHNHLVLPLVLYLSLYSSIRDDFFRKRTIFTPYSTAVSSGIIVPRIVLSSHLQPREPTV
ncbi:hypothetical protein QR680_010040 [Steinernema hermaphroditum]|uniref:Uncharacterized protein n=1 Tax=Steinernema hermaphroditum TaxID=289476 RepID=A0AA39IPE1_9BILA|nr:hypothetical protein QR680_010040 [Steinernema hermaphroditum]